MTPWRAVQVAVVLLVVVVLSFQLLGGDDDAQEQAGAGTAELPFPPAETRVDVDTPALREAKAAAGVEDCPGEDCGARAGGERAAAADAGVPGRWAGHGPERPRAVPPW